MALDLLLGRVCPRFHLHDCLVQIGSMLLKLSRIVTIFCVLDLYFDSYGSCAVVLERFQNA